ncbi:hypothetical protein MBLNU459_g7624t1 [Dothideomycetes sp. NU459]
MFKKLFRSSKTELAHGQSAAATGTITTTTASAAANAAATTVHPALRYAPQVVGLVTDPSLNRDSCASVVIDGRALWTCRDTQPISNGRPVFPIWSSSASWTTFNTSIANATNGSSRSLAMVDRQLLMTGSTGQKPFYPFGIDECGDNTAGGCPDGTRYAIWPDSPPMVASTKPDGSAVAYTWISRAHIRNDFSSVDPQPPATLYRIEYSRADTGLPAVTIVDEEFWPNGSIPFGVYGNVVRNGMAYLWGRSSAGIALARVPTDGVDDICQYEYWVNGAWTSDEPEFNDTTINIPNVSAGGQGTYYYSDAWQSYVWIGQPGLSIYPDFYITTAPDPTGPWTQPRHFYSAPGGNGTFPGYSLQAHPGLGSPGGNGIYLTYTRMDVDASGVAYYSTPLIEVQWA